MITKNCKIASLMAVAAWFLTVAPGAHSEVARPPDNDLFKVHSFSHRLAVGSGRTLFVTVHFTLGSLLREPRRAAVFLTGPEFRGSFWRIPVEGYNGPAMAAERGFFAYTFDYFGVGESFLPEDGSQVSYLTQVAPTRALIDFVRRAWRVDTVDLIGEGYGAAIASELADEPERVRSVVMSTVVYKTRDPGILPFFTPQLEAFLRGRPNGYWEPDFLDLTLGFSPDQDLRDHVLATQKGSYPTGPALAFWDLSLPIVNAPAAVVPGLVIIGELDPFPAPGDSAALAADWGGGAGLTVIAGSSHVPRIEAREIADQYFGALFDFIDPRARPTLPK